MSMQNPLPQTSGVDANQFVTNNKLFVQHNKQVATDAIATGDNNTANAIAASGVIVPTANAVTDHINTYNAHSWWQNALSGAENVFGHFVNAAKKVPGVGTVIDWSAKGLNEIQKDYKFVSSLYDKHGPVAGILGTLGVVAGGVLGSAFGPEGTVFGADLAGAAERNILGRIVPNFQDSLKDSDNPNYHADLGRQVAHGLANIPGFGALRNTDVGVGQIVSGVLDAAFDFKTDPLALVGKFSAGLKSGKYMVEAKNADGTAMVDNAGKPIYKPSMRIAAQSDSVNDFIVARTGVATSNDQLAKAYAGNAAFKNAVDDIAKRSNPIEIQKLYPESKFTTQAAQALAKASNEGEVLSVLGKTLYSDELAVKGAPTAALTLPTRGWAKNFSGNLLENIRKNEQATTIEDTANFLIPKKNPILNSDGTQKLDENGFVQYKSVAPAIASGQWMNALAGKVRTFTGMKAVAFNPDLLKQSGKEINWDDAQAGQAVFNILYSAMPYDMAMEHTANIMLETDPYARSTKFHEAQKETLKAAGLPASTKMLDKILAQGRRATFGDEMQRGIYQYDHEAKALGAVEMKDGSIKTTGLYGWQRAGDAMLDFKQMRVAMRATKAYGALYNHVDDFYTKYTNVIFAPLTLLSTAFGLRVAASEALHQIIRKGLPDYLNNIIVDAAAARNYKLKTAEQRALADATAQALTPTEHDALVSGKELTDNEVLADARAKDKTIKALAKNVQDLGLNKGKLNDIAQNFTTVKGRIAPLEWAAHKYYKVASYSVRDKVDALTRLHMSTGTDSLLGDVNSAHAGSADMNAADRVDMFSQNFGHGMKPGEQLHGLTPNDPHYQQYWALNINKMAKDEIGQAIAADYLRLKTQANLKGLSQDELWAQVQQQFQKRVEDPAQFSDLRRSLRVLDQAKPESYAAQAVSGIRGLVTGSDKTVHENLIQAIKNGDTIYSKDLLKLPVEQMPNMVLGRLMKPSTENIMQRVVEFGYRTAVNPVMNFVSRQPLFAHFFYEQYRTYKPMVEQGLIDEDTALRMAALNGTKDMLPLIHNPQLRSQFSVMHRNLLPFYFAQEQAMKRVGRLILTNPQGFRDFQMISQGLNNPGFVHTDSSGKKYIVYPLVGEFGNAAARGLNALGLKQFTGLPESVIGNTSSLLTVLPEVKVPSVGTFTNITLAELNKVFPWMDTITNAVTAGHPASNFMDAVIPNSTMRDIYNGMTFDQRENTVYNSMLSAIAAAYYHGDLKDDYAQLPPAQQQAIMDKIEGNARSNLFIKGLLSFFLPLSPSVSNDYYTKAGQSFNSEFRTILNEEMAKDQKNGYATALSRFLQEHGNQAISYTVTHTTDGLNGAKIPLAQSTLDWVAQNQKLMTDFPNGSGYLIPQTAADKNALKVENKLLQMQLRSKKTPADFMRAIYIQHGWNDIQDNYNSFQDYVNKARAQGNRYAVSQAVQAWNNYTGEYGLSNPIWYEDYTGKSKVVNAQLALGDLQKMQTKGLLTGEQGSKISDILDNYKNFNAMLQQQIVNGTKTPMYSQYKTMWLNYLDTLSSDAKLTSVINSVFRRVA